MCLNNGERGKAWRPGVSHIYSLKLIVPAEFTRQTSPCLQLGQEKILPARIHRVCAVLFSQSLYSVS